MEYRSIGRTGMTTSAIGLGMEHLLRPSVQRRVVRRAIDDGVTFFDLMIWRPALKDSFGEALRGQREGIVLAGHLGAAEERGAYRRTRDVAECESLWHDWLRRLGTDRIDICHISNMDEPDDYAQVTGAGGIVDLARRLREAGKARAISLSCHNPEVGLWAIRDGWADVVMNPITMVWHADAAMHRLTQACVEHGVGLLGMKPFFGGRLLEVPDPPTPVQCLHYTLSQPGVAVAVTGVRGVGELESAMGYWAASVGERDYSPLLGRTPDFERLFCTMCEHCQPCPEGVNIAGALRLLPLSAKGVTPELRAQYERLKHRPSACTGCAICAPRCPFGRDIPTELAEVVRRFGE